MMVAAAGAFVTSCDAQSPVAVTPVEAPIKRCINLGNGLEAPREGEWGYRIEQAHFFDIARQGFDTVRIPVRWDVHMAQSPGYEIDPRHFERVDEVVAQALAAGLQVILNVHHNETFLADPTGQRTAFLSLWRQISHRYADHSDALIFELLNEPVDTIDSASLSRLHADTLAVVRQSNPTRRVILGAENWNSLNALERYQPPVDANLILTFHSYEPWAFTHQGAEWMDDAPPSGRDWGRASERRDLEKLAERAARLQSRTRLPVFLGEFGVIETVPLALRVEWTRAKRFAMEAQGIGWCYWDFAGAFGIYDTGARSFSPVLLDALIPARRSSPFDDAYPSLRQ